MFKKILINKIVKKDNKYFLYVNCMKVIKEKKLINGKESLIDKVVNNIEGIELPENIITFIKCT
jgi:hypothetical protein